MNHIAREFLGRLHEEEISFMEKLKDDEIGLRLLTAIKEFDWYYYNYIRSEPTEDADVHMHLLQLGLPKVIAGVLHGVPKFVAPVVTFKSDDSQIRDAFEFVAGCGFIEQGRRLVHAAMAGECEIVRFDDRQYDIVMPDMVRNMEHHESVVERHYKSLFRAQSDAALQEVFGPRMNRINELLKENVYVFARSWMGYDAHPELDDFFYLMASNEIQDQNGYDTFNAAVTFGGVTMQKYILATTYFLSLALKHEKFAETLVEKEPDIRLRDILTITTPRQRFEDELIEALNEFGPHYDGYTPLTRDEAKTILRVLSVRRDNLAMLTPTMAPLPFLVEYSDTAWITSVASVRMAAVPFLLDSLRHCFPADYDRNQQRREGSMQRALRGMLEDYIPGLHLAGNVGVRKNGRLLTDIDFGAVDPADGTVILFQLKHQDHYGGDIRRRSNRSGRLVREVSHWLEVVRTWLSEEPDALRHALRLPARAKCGRVYLVVIGRHFAHFVSTLDLRDDAAYATWFQLFDAFNRQRAEGRSQSLLGLADILQRYMSHVMAKPYEYDLLDSYHLTKVSYRIRPASAGGEDVGKTPGEDTGSPA
jgi:hypothetical protein